MLYIKYGDNSDNDNSIGNISFVFFLDFSVSFAIFLGFIYLIYE